MNERTILEVIKRYCHEDSCKWGNYFDDPEKIVFVADWWKVPDRVKAYIDRHFENNDQRFYDEITECSGCYNLVDTQPHYYGDIKKYWIHDEGIECENCARENGFEYYLESLIDCPDRANVLMTHEELAEKGFELIESDLETGWHPHQTDDPKTMLSELKAKFPSREFIFNIISAGQFDIRWSVYSREVTP